MQKFSMQKLKVVTLVFLATFVVYVAFTQFDKHVINPFWPVSNDIANTRAFLLLLFVVFAIIKVNNRHYNIK